MNTPTLRRRILSPLLLGLLCALTMANAAFAKPGPLAAFKGSTKGTFSVVTTGGLFPMGGSGPGTDVFTTKSKDTQGQLVLTAHDSMNPAIEYSTTLKFNAKGKCTALSIVPGVTSATGKGTWSVKGSKITYKLSGKDSSGSYTVKGTVTRTGKKVSVTGNFTVKSSFPGFPTGGTYTFK
jgi:hypothetical protein